MTRLKWLTLVFLRYYRSMGLRVLLYALLSIAATLISPFVNPYIGQRFSTEFDFASVTPVLTILATTMLAVSTFSLNIMVSAHRAAAETATPRIHRVLLEDTTTQSVLAVFIGAFVYSLGSLVLFRLGFYPQDAAFVVMVITTLVVVAVIVSLLRWINHLTTLGSLEDSLQTARQRAKETLVAQARHPWFGASPLTEDTVLPNSTTPLCAPETGYLQLIDMAMLHQCLPHNAQVYLDVSPGSHVLIGQTIGQVAGVHTDDVLDQLTRAFTFGPVRTHEQDAAFGLITLSEIASKALSPGINDSGTAIEVLMILKSLLWGFLRADPKSTTPDFPTIFARFPAAPDFLHASFAPIARDGADRIEVSLALVESLAALLQAGDDALAMAAQELAAETIALAQKRGLPECDLNQLRAVQFATDT